MRGNHMMDAGESRLGAVPGAAEGAPSPETRGLPAPAASAGRCRRGERGTTILEVLVVAVILLVGIYTVVRLFPVGFDVVDRGGELTRSDRYAHTWLDWVNVDPEGLPEAVVPSMQVENAVLGSVTPLNLNIRPTDEDAKKLFVSTVATLDDAGLRAFPNPVIQFRKLMCESTRLPSATNGRVRYALRFGPVEWYGSATEYQHLITIYSLDGYVRVDKADLDNHKGQDRYYAVEGAGNTRELWFSGVTGQDRTFKVDYLVAGATGVEQVVDVVAVVPASADGSMVQAQDTAGQNIELGDTNLAFVAETENVRRRFHEQTNEPSATDPYAYTLVDNSTGVVEFPLNGSIAGKRVGIDYSVMDWQILRDDIEVPIEPDPGQSSTPAAERVAWVKLSFPFVDQAALAPQDARNGMLRCLLLQNIDPNHPDYGEVIDPENDNNDPASSTTDPGYTWTFTDPLRPRASQSIAGRLGIRVARMQMSGQRVRKVRVLYRTMDGVAAQLMRASKSYRWAGSAATAPGYDMYLWNAANKRLQFALMHVGKSVSVDYSYQDGAVVRKVSGEMHTIDQDGFVFLKNVPGDSPLHSIDAVRGMSLEMRVVWAVTGTPARVYDILNGIWGGTATTPPSYWTEEGGKGRLQTVTAAAAVTGGAAN